MPRGRTGAPWTRTQDPSIAATRAETFPTRRRTLQGSGRRPSYGGRIALAMAACTKGRAAHPHCLSQRRAARPCVTASPLRLPTGRRMSIGANRAGDLRRAHDQGGCLLGRGRREHGYRGVYAR